MQGLPFWVVVAILAAFLLLIAPGDYFLLGVLRARRFTWISLTVTSLAFTVGTVRITERVMGNDRLSTACSSSPIVGPEGAPVKTSRYELLLHRHAEDHGVALSERIVRGDRRSDDASGMLRAGGNYYATSEIDRRRRRSRKRARCRPAGIRRQAAGRLRRASADAAMVAARQPADVARRLDSHVPKLNWDGLGKSPWDRAEGRRELLETIREIEPEARVLLFHGTSLHDVAFGTGNGKDGPFCP